MGVTIRDFPYIASLPTPQEIEIVTFIPIDNAFIDSNDSPWL